MKKTVRILTFIISVICFMVCCEKKNESQENEVPENSSTKSTNVVMWKNNDKVNGVNYISFRIPTLLKTPNKVFAFIEARQTTTDRGDIDIVYKVSEDNGETWSESVLLFSDNDHTVGNACAVYTKSGRICMLFNWFGKSGATDSDFPTPLGVTAAQKKEHNRRVFYTYSDDEGDTWSTPLDITDTVMDSKWTWNAVGPVHPIELQVGEYAGRIVFPCDLKTASGGERDNLYSYCIYSDDYGETWQKSSIIPYGNESTVVELSDGRLHLDMRNSNSAYYEDGLSCRTYSISNDGGATWVGYTYDTTRPEPTPESGGTKGCQGSILNYNTDGIPTSNILFINPADEVKRQNLTLRWSNNDGETWRKSEVINSGLSGYSDIIVLDEGAVGILYENGYGAYDDQVSFKIKPANEIRKNF